MFHTPVLLIVFNRPNALLELIKVLEVVKPNQLYVAADGPRSDHIRDIRLCAEVKDLISNLKWECKIHTLYNEKNLGCGRGPYEAITWFFTKVEAGIILEDDSLPHPDFFDYSAELLERYRNINTIKVIGSANFQQKQFGKHSYYFSMQNGCFCSWATWKRTWEEYDYTLSRNNNNLLKKSLRYYNVSLKEYVYWIDIFNRVKKDRFNESCWDYQLMFSIWKNKGVGIVPNVNLATNIGFNSDATHTLDSTHQGANKQAHPILPLTHPAQIHIEREADLFYHNFYYQPRVSGITRLINDVVLCNKLIKSWFNISQSWKHHVYGMPHKLYLFVAGQKAEFKNKLYWSQKAKKLKNDILNHYKQVPDDEVTDEELEVVNYIKKEKIAVLPYSFTKKYKKNNVTVFYDPSFDLNYVIFENKKLYYRRGWDVYKIKSYHSYLLAEQDSSSPHCYISKSFTLQSGNTLVDVGAAEGIFTLMNIDKINKAYILEPDKYWIEALNATFTSWSSKVTIIEKYIGFEQISNVISIDELFEDIEVDFIKIDVEGWEREVLKGAAKIFSRSSHLKVVVATYHKQNDEVELMNVLTASGFKASYTNGFLAYHYDANIQRPYLRRCLIQAVK